MSTPARKDMLLIDTSFLYALADPADIHRAKAAAFARRDSRTRIIPEVALTEVMYLVGRFVNHMAMARFLFSIASSNAQIESMRKTDLLRAQEIMIKYSDARFDFVDCSIMALAERLNIACICTFDRRDFGLFKPTHCEQFELLP